MFSWWNCFFAHSFNCCTSSFWFCWMSKRVIEHFICFLVTSTSHVFCYVFFRCSSKTKLSTLSWELIQIWHNKRRDHPFWKQLICQHHIQTQLQQLSWDGAKTSKTLVNDGDVLPTFPSMGDRRISSINRYHSPVGSGASHQLSPLVDRMLWLFTPPLHHSQPAQWGPGSSQWPFKGCSMWPFQGWKRDLHLGYQKVTWKKLGDWFNIDLFFLVQTFFGSTIILEYLEHASGNWTFPSFPNRNIIKTLKLVRYFDVFQDGFIWTDTLRCLKLGKVVSKYCIIPTC